MELKVSIATIDAVNEARKSLRTGQKYSQMDDVDSGFVINKLRSGFPNQPDGFLDRCLSLVIYWYYLR